MIFMNAGPMPYITQSELEDAYGVHKIAELADRDGDGVSDTAIIEGAIERATGVIDSYLRSRFTLPLATVPDLVREAALSLTRYHLANEHASDRIREDYKQALGWLRDIREGKMDVGLDGTDTAVAPTSGGPQFAHDGGVFDKDDLDAFRWKR